jgi:two-component system nitrogen regulation response regulator NtrX
MNSTKNVLVIDDEPDVCAYLKDLLKYFGYEVSFALSCKDAIDHLKQQPYTAVLLDMHMGGESGEVVLRWLRSLGRNDPVIMMSAMPHYQMRIDLIFKGAAELLGKPVQPTQLHQVLQKVTTQPSASTVPPPVVHPNRLAKAF